MAMGPAHTYYLACQGRWSAPLHLRVRDVGSLARVIGWFDAVVWWVVGRLPGLRVSTSVAVLDDAEVLHTTRIHWASLTLVASEERLSLNGAAGRLDGRSRTLLGARDAVTGTVAVSADAVHARYQLCWLGIELVQTADRRDGSVRLVQRAPGLESEARLVRLDRAATAGDRRAPQDRGRARSGGTPGRSGRRPSAP